MTGKPKAFPTPQDLQEKFKEYITNCPDAIPTITGFCLYCDINRDTFYGYKEYDGYSDTLKRIDDYLEQAAVNQMMVARNPAAQMFYLKNKFNWADKQEISNNLTVNTDFTQLSDAELENRLNQLGYAKMPKQLEPSNTNTSEE